MLAFADIYTRFSAGRAAQIYCDSLVAATLMRYVELLNPMMDQDLVNPQAHSEAPLASSATDTRKRKKLLSALRAIASTLFQCSGCMALGTWHAA